MTGQRTEPPNRLLRRLARSLASWLTFQQIALRSPMYSEYFMYTPIFEIAAARGWKVSPQSHFKARVEIKDSREWKHRYVDFVFYHASKKLAGDVAAVEISYINEDSRRNKIRCDICKLSAFKSRHFSEVKHSRMNRYILIAAKEDCLTAYCNKAKLNQGTTVLEDGEDAKTLGFIYRASNNLPSSWCVLVLYVPERVPRRTTSRRKA